MIHLVRSRIIDRHVIALCGIPLPRIFIGAGAVTPVVAGIENAILEKAELFCPTCCLALAAEPT